MPIAALPQTTIRAIGSTSVISDPCSIVKELLENSLDADATAVFIEISQNTVDVIQVKDNGHGIASEDHPFVCRRAFTSKISTVEDLRNLGGKSLGFRGEALASAAEVSGGVTITTRVATEPVGSVIKYGRNGDLISTQRASHPVGSTVRVTDLFKHIPVRRQTVLKSTSKMIVKIKKIIQSYTIAQPTIRLSLKVLKANNEKANWVYAPGKDATLMDAALKVAGTEVASACITKQWPCEDADDGSGDGGGSAFKVMALLANPDADYSKVNHAGQFFSVDGKPISSARGIGQEIAKLYKSYLRATATHGERPVNVSDPLLCLQIRCPEASYDVNVEPAKDDVLFEDQQCVLSLAEDLFRNTYGEKDGAEKPKTSAKGKEKMTNDNAFELLLARKDPAASSDMAHGSYKAPNFVSASSLFQRIQQKNGPHEQRSPVGDEDPGASSNSEGRDLEGLNPWSVTQLYAPAGTSYRTPSKKPTTSGRLQFGTQDSEPRSSETPQTGSTDSVSSSASTPYSRLTKSPTDSRSSDSVSNPAQTSPITPLHNPAIRSRVSRQRDRERYGNGALDTWFQKTTQASLQREPIEQELENGETPLSQLPQERFAASVPYVSSTKNVHDTGNIPDLAVPTGLEPSRPASTVGSSHGGSRASDAAPRRLDQWSARLHQLSNSDHNHNHNHTPELERALDFETRKREAILKLRERKNNPTPANPHVSRYRAAKATLHPSSSAEQETTRVPNSLNPHDPRSYLMRHQSTHKQGEPPDAKIRRINTNKLPLEKIPDGYDLHDVCVVQPAGLPLIARSFLSQRDLTRTEDEDMEFIVSDDAALLWEGRLATLIKMKYRTIQGSEIPVVQIDFSDLGRLSEL